MTAVVWEGGILRSCREHRTTGSRAWCFDCGTWCYPDALCPGCRTPNGVEAALDRLALLETVVKLARDLHRPIQDGHILRCRECRRDWPCDTSWKLDGLDSEDAPRDAAAPQQR